jgi:hypothetical protein
MRKFIKRTLIFLLTLIGAIILFYFCVSFIERKYSNFKLKDSPNYIIVGHSHSECAYNDSLIPACKNLSQSGEAYFYTYFKIRQIIKQNPSVKVLFIELANNQVTERMDSWIWGNNYMSNNYPKYFSFMSGSDNLLLARKNPSMYFNALSWSMKNSLYRICRGKLDFTHQIGGYVYLDRDIKDTLVNVNTQTSASLKTVSEKNLSHLDAIIEFCKKNGVEPVLIRSPLHERYRGYENEKLYTQIIEKRYSSVVYLDFSKFPLPDSAFGDFEHLNYKGARVFSKWFSSMLQHGVLSMSNKQGYIDKAIREERTKLNLP